MNPAPIHRSPCRPYGPAVPVTGAVSFASASATGAPVTTNQFTRQVIRQLLDGADADTFAAIPLASYGPWAEVVRLLCEAFAAGKANGERGTQAVATVYRSLV